MKKVILATALVVALTGCASTDYLEYAKAQVAIASAKSESEKARYEALSKIAQTGGDAAKVAAVISIQMNQQSSQPTQSIAAPKSTGDTILQWASVIVPAATQAYAIGKNAEVQIQSSNNSAAVAQSTNNAFVGIASKIQAPGAVSNSTSTVTNTTTTTTNTDSTHAPTVVTQPAPLVVTQPAPVIVDPTVVNPVVVNQPAPTIVNPVVVQPQVVNPVVVNTTQPPVQ